MPVTLRDIAERVGKSVPTVSRALGGFGDISPETRAEVQRVAEELGYEPSATATNLKKRRTDTITLVLPTEARPRFADPFFSEFVSGVVDQAAQHHLDLAVVTNAGDDECATYRKYIRSRRTDGFIVMRTKLQDERIEFLRDDGFPFVAFGRTGSDNDFHFVDEDGAAGIRLAVDHLVALGHRRLAFIAEPLYLTKASHRLQGFRDGLHAHDLPCEPDLVIEANFRQPSGRLATQKLLNRADPPTAIVACNDLLALGAMSEAHARGLVVGREVSITGFDDIMLAEYTHPALTTVHQPAQEMGALVVDLLVRIIHKQPLETPQIIRMPTLVVRESSGPPPAA